MNVIRLFWNYRRLGLNDWIAQRLSVVFIIVYALPLLVMPLMTNNLELWRSVVFHPVMKVLGSLAAFSIMWHSKIGLWVVISDYVPRGFLQTAATLIMYIYVWLVFLLFLLIFWS